MRIRTSLIVAAGMALAFAGSAEAKKALDAGLFMTYTPDGPNLTYFVCGSLDGSGNNVTCYGVGSLGLFEHACAVLEGAPQTKGDVVTRALYVLDKRHSKNDPALLYVYTRTDDFSAGYAVSTTLDKTITLDFDGGDKASCQLAGNNAAVYAGVVGSGTIDAIDKKKLTVTKPSTLGPLLSFTIDDRGYTAINFGGSGSSEILDPNGVMMLDGGGNSFVSNAHNALPLP